MLQSKCLGLATGAHWYVSNRQIHEDLGVPFFADHIRALTASFDSKLAVVGNSLVQQLGRYADRRLSPLPDAKAKGGRRQQPSRGYRSRFTPQKLLVIYTANKLLVVSPEHKPSADYAHKCG